MHKLISVLICLAAVVISFTSCDIKNTTTKDYSVSQKNETSTVSSAEDSFSNPQKQTNEKSNVSNIPAYSGQPYVELNNNKPSFTDSEITTTSSEYYSELDSLGRCGVCKACIGSDIMPTEERGAIGMVKPSGWKIAKYDCVDGKYLYNRCHLIGYQLTGENANVKNLITGTRYLNVDGMLPFENEVADYIHKTDNHVLYRVTPIFEGDNLLASGVQIEAYSVEDSGKGISFNVYCYNVQPNIEINYADGTSKLHESSNSSIMQSDKTQTYILNKSSKKFHFQNCDSVKDINEKNKAEYNGSREELIKQGYKPCGNCNP